MKLFFKLSLLTISLLTINRANANASQKVWKSYFPQMNCQLKPCGKNLPAAALEEFLEKASYLFPGKLENNKWAFLVDMTKHSKQKRGYLINLKTGLSTAYHTSHGKGSGNGAGRAVRFSNINNSKMTSLGLYTTAETYSGSKGFSMRLDGHEQTNSRARSRAIVVHKAAYMDLGFIRANGRGGRSWGCPAFPTAHYRKIIKKIKGGSLFYIYHQ